MKSTISKRAASGGMTIAGFEPPSWLEGLREDYEKTFVHRWSPYFGAVLLVVVSMVLMTRGLFWGVFGGMKLWGDHFNNLVGLGSLLGIDDTLENPLLHRISLMDINLVLGAFSAALLSGQFRFRRPPKLEYVWGALGGIFMGVGATLAGGCTVGGFFTPLMFASPAGWAMGCGLMAGAFLGLKLLIWSMKTVSWGVSAPRDSGAPLLKGLYPLLGLAILICVLCWTLSWYQASDKMLVSRAIIIPVGFGLGFILHRSRFCFAKVFREPFMTGDGSITKAMILAFVLGIPVSSLLLQNNTVDPYLAIPATFWLGSSLGGLVFGIGMIFAGGCASGALWRLGEGQLKLAVAVFFFGWSGSVCSAILKRWEVLTPQIDLDFIDGLVEFTKVGYQAYLPDLTGNWSVTYLVCFGVLAFWYFLVRYNESTGKFMVI
jgi:uncharacterized membrane protein YedE/YeeE